VLEKYEKEERKFVGFLRRRHIYNKSRKSVMMARIIQHKTVKGKKYEGRQAENTKILLRYLHLAFKCNLKATRVLTSFARSFVHSFAVV